MSSSHEQHLQQPADNGESNEWAAEGGANASPLSPAGEGVIKTLPPSDISVFPFNLPAVQNEIIALNDIYISR